MYMKVMYCVALHLEKHQPYQAVRGLGFCNPSTKEGFCPFIIFEDIDRANNNMLELFWTYYLEELCCLNDKV